MRVAYVSADHGIPVFGDKGASVHVQELVHALRGLGHDVTLLAARLGDADGAGLDAQAVKVRVAGGGAQAGDRAAKERRYQDIGRAAEAQIVEMHARRPFDFIYERYSLWSAAGVRAAKRLGIPCVVEMNAPLIVEQRRYRKLEQAERAEAIETEVLTGADHLVAVSEPVRDYAVSRGADPARSHVLPNAVNVDRFHPAVAASPLSRDPRDFVIGFTGSLKPWHGMEALLPAFRDLQREHGGYRLLIVGDGPLRPWVEGFASGADIADRMTITGWVANGELPSLLQCMDVTVAPYPPLDDFYFSPLKLFEYMAMGKPVVASAVGQIANIIEHERNGLLTGAGDVGALAASIARLRDDRALRARLGGEAAATARARTWRDNAREVVGLATSARLAA